MVLQSRIENYEIDQIKVALYDDRTLIDGWDKQMGIYQTKEYPDFHLIRKERSDGALKSLKDRVQINPLQHVNEIINILKVDGPKYSTEISIGKTKKHSWGTTKPSSATLDLLFHKGKIGVVGRRNTQKQYDLLENLIGDLAKKKTKFTKDSFIKWCLYRRICSMGLVWNKSSVAWHGLYIKNKTVRNKYLKELIKERKVQRITIDGLKEDFFIPFGALDKAITVTDKVSFIAPLDNLIWDRELVHQVFDFHYRWEVYTPIISRKYGYYVLPVLYNNSFMVE